MASRATPARLLALDITREVRVRNAYTRELVDSKRRDSRLPEEEFAYAQVLAFGVAMCKGTCDELVDRNLRSRRDVKDKVRDCLRISAYELAFLEKPAHVVVDQGVELVRSCVPRACGLANAVLRKMAKDVQGFPWGDAAGDMRALARSYGVPEWLAVELCSQYGQQQCARILASSLAPAPTYLASIPNTREPFAADLSSQFVASLVPLEGRVLEIGAGRGTKTLLMQMYAHERLGRSARIDAVELHAYRVRIIEQRLSDAHIDAVRVFEGDARELGCVQGLEAHYGAVLVDVPCSGTGTLRRHPEIRWRLEPDDVRELAALQLELLRAAAGRVAPGGVIVYATCSILRQENRDVVDAFLESPEGAGFTIRSVDALSDEQKAQAPGWRIDAAGCFSSVPTEGGPDGHFAALLERSMQ